MLVGGGKPAQRRDHQADRQIGDILGEDIGRVRHPDTASARDFEVDLLVSHPGDGDKTERRQPLDHVVGDSEVPSRHNGTDRVLVLIEPAVPVRQFLPAADAVSPMQFFFAAVDEGS